MATNHLEGPTDATDAGTDRGDGEAPGIAHLTVVPENAEQ